MRGAAGQPLGHTTLQKGAILGCQAGPCGTPFVKEALDLRHGPLLLRAPPVVVGVPLVSENLGDLVPGPHHGFPQVREEADHLRVVPQTGAVQFVPERQREPAAYRVNGSCV